MTALVQPAAPLEAPQVNPASAPVPPAAAPAAEPLGRPLIANLDVAPLVLRARPTTPVSDDEFFAF